MTVFFIVLAAIPAGIFLIGVLLSGPRYHGPTSEHFNGKVFVNPHGAEPHGFSKVLKWMVSRQRGEWKEDKESTYGERPLKFFKDGIRITFVNHSTFLIQVDGINILTDPVWSKRVSPFRFMGPKRRRVPGIRLEDLPHIHVVLLSHNHYDHLDLPTMRTIFGAHHPKIITPLGVKNFLDKESMIGSTDLDWWDEVHLSETVNVQAVPAQHFSGRGMFDRDATLWCGYVLKTSVGKIYFAGDTGYNGTTFKEIGTRTGPFKLSVLPIGAYKPNWFMSPVHTSPDEAVKIHLEVGSEKSIAAHFGTFPLADESTHDSITDLKEALKKYKVSEDKFLTLKEGVPFIIE